MSQIMERLLSEQDVLMVIAKRNGKLQTQCQSRNHFAAKSVGSTGCLALNLCSKTPRQEKNIRSTPTLVRKTVLIDDDDENPWEKIRGRHVQSVSCKELLMQGLNSEWTSAYESPELPTKFRLQANKCKSMQLLSDKTKIEAIKKKRTKSDRCCGKPTCSKSRLPNKSCNHSSKNTAKKALGGSCDLSKEFQIYLNKMMHKFKHFRCKPAIPVIVPKCAHTITNKSKSMLHSKCDDSSKMVPSHMGWDWNYNRKERNAGWRPGAIPKSVRQLMHHFLEPYPCDTIPVTKRPKALPELKSKNIIQPVIQLQRHNDEYTVTLNTVDKDQAAKPPVCVTISASVEQRQMAKVKEMLIGNGFRYCFCGRSLANCECRSRQEMETIYRFVRQIEQKFRIHNVMRRLCFERSKDLFLEFTPANVTEKMVHEGPNETLEVVRKTDRNSQNDLKSYSHSQHTMDDFKKLSQVNRPMQDTATSNSRIFRDDISCKNRSTKDDATSYSRSMHNYVTSNPRIMGDDISRNSRFTQCEATPNSRSIQDYAMSHPKKSHSQNNKRSTQDDATSYSRIENFNVNNGFNQDDAISYASIANGSNNRKFTQDDATSYSRSVNFANNNRVIQDDATSYSRNDFNMLGKSVSKDGRDNLQSIHTLSRNTIPSSHALVCPQNSLPTISSSSLGSKTVRNSIQNGVSSSKHSSRNTNENPNNLPQQGEPQIKLDSSIATSKKSEFIDNQNLRGDLSKTSTGTNKDSMRTLIQDDLRQHAIKVKPNQDLVIDVQDNTDINFDTRIEECQCAQSQPSRNIIPSLKPVKKDSIPSEKILQDKKPVSKSNFECCMCTGLPRAKSQLSNQSTNPQINDASEIPQRNPVERREEVGESQTGEQVHGKRGRGNSESSELTKNQTNTVPSYSAPLKSFDNNSNQMGKSNHTIASQKPSNSSHPSKNRVNANDTNVSTISSISIYTDPHNSMCNNQMKSIQSQDKTHMSMISSQRVADASKKPEPVKYNEAKRISSLSAFRDEEAEMAHLTYNNSQHSIAKSVKSNVTYKEPISGTIKATQSDLSKRRKSGSKQLSIPRMSNVSHASSQYKAEDYKHLFDKYREEMRKRRRKAGKGSGSSSDGDSSRDEDGNSRSKKLSKKKSGRKSGKDRSDSDDVSLDDEGHPKERPYQADIEGQKRHNADRENKKGDDETKQEHNGTHGTKQRRSKKIRGPAKMRKNGVNKRIRKSSLIRLIHVGQHPPQVCCGHTCHDHYACQEYGAGVNVCQRGLDGCEFGCLPSQTYGNCNWWE